MLAVALLRSPFPVTRSITPSKPKPFTSSSSSFFNRKRSSSSFPRDLVVGAKKRGFPNSDDQNLPDIDESVLSENVGGLELDWLPAFPHVFTASLANFLFGYHIGVMNGPIISIARELGFEGNPLLEGLVVSIFIAGAFIGSLSSGALVDNLGCRRTLQIDTIPLILGAILSAQAHSVDEVLWGRFLVGLGIGVNTVLVPIYISEVSPTRYRGSLGTLCEIGTCLGILVSLLLGIPSENDPHWWRTMLYIASIPGFVLIIGMQFAVDSPRWLCKVGRWDDAKKVVYNLWDKSEADKSIEEFRSVITNDGSDLEASWLELLVEPHNRVAFIGGALFVFEQFSGINGVLYFSSLTFKDVGVRSGALASIFIGLTNFAGALFALYLMDKQGRRRLLVGSYLGMDPSSGRTFGHGHEERGLCIFEGPQSRGVAATITTSRSLESAHLSHRYIFSFAAGAGPVTAMIIPELSSTRTRAKIMGFSFAVHWVCNFLVGLFFLELVDNFGLAPVYASFGGVALLSAIFAKYAIVETKGRSLEEIEISMNRR